MARVGVKRQYVRFGYARKGTSDSGRFADPIFTQESGIGGSHTGLIKNKSHFGVRIEKGAGDGDDNIITWNEMEDGTYIATAIGTDSYLKFVNNLADSSTKFSFIGGRKRNATGRWGRFGAGEPLVVDGVRYKGRMFGFGDYKNELKIKGTKEDDIERYVKPCLSSDGWGFPQGGTTGFASADDVAVEFVSTSKIYAKGYEALIDNYGEFKFSGNKSTNTYFWPVLVPEEHTPFWVSCTKDAGTQVGALSVKATLDYYDGDTLPRMKYLVDGVEVATVDGRIAANREAEMIPEDIQHLIKSGSHTLTLRAMANNGRYNDSTLRYVKKSRSIDVAGKPSEQDAMPTRCAVVKAEVLGRGATSEWMVCNNALDDLPAWEVYAGGDHVFANKSKTAAKWAVAWKCKIDGTKATEKSALLKSVAMAVDHE